MHCLFTLCHLFHTLMFPLECTHARDKALEQERASACSLTRSHARERTSARSADRENESDCLFSVCEYLKQKKLSVQGNLSSVSPSLSRVFSLAHCTHSLIPRNISMSSTYLYVCVCMCCWVGVFLCVRARVYGACVHVYVCVLAYARGV